MNPDPKLPDAVKDEVRAIVREELAALGGHLLSEYGERRTAEAATNPLGTLGGYILQEYGDG